MKPIENLYKTLINNYKPLKPEIATVRTEACEITQPPNNRFRANAPRG